MALFAMFSLLVPRYDNTELFSITTTGDHRALFIMSLAALIANAAVFAYTIIRVIKTKKNPYSNEMYTHLESYKEVVAFNNLR